MIKLCPHCGYTLSRELKDGLSSCDNCHRTFDISIYHQALSAAWVVRKWHIDDIEQLRWKFKFDDKALELVDEFVINQCYSHDEFINLLSDINPLELSA